MIQRLIKSGHISQEKKELYNIIRSFRNMSFHPSSQSQWGFVSLDTVKLIVNEINELFDTLDQRKSHV